MGFFRQPLSEVSSQRLLLRPCVPCRCSNHSERCDAESGRCQVPVAAAVCAAAAAP